MVHKEKVQLKDSMEINKIKKIRFSSDTSELTNSVCAHPDCGIMFDESSDTYVYKCQACDSYFHSDCFLAKFSENGKCPYCHFDSQCVE